MGLPVKVYVSERLIYAAPNCVGIVDHNCIKVTPPGPADWTAPQFAYVLKPGQYVKVTTTETECTFRVDE